MSPNKVMTIDTIDRQKKYVAEIKKRGQGLGVVFAGAFLRGMRDLGYKSPAWALAEPADNSFQAGADTIVVRFGFDSQNKSKTKPDQVALCDNGNGMIPEMIEYAVRWGGTDREGDRTGFGRYGYGLPSSAVSIAKRYTVYSKALEGTWHAVTVDIDELGKVAGDLKKTGELLVARPAELPTWVVDSVKDDDSLELKKLKSGTVIVYEELDRLKQLTGWMKCETLRTKLLQHFGVVYRHWIPEKQIIVDGAKAQAVDPLFLMEHARFYDETPVLARRIETRRQIEVETSDGKKGAIKIRASYLPYDFQKPLQGPGTNGRYPTMREYNGLIICRESRQIDCIAPKWTKFQNNDAHIKIEIDFDPVLDEYFGITTSKQQIVIDDEIWEKLKHDGKEGGGILNLIRSMRAEYRKEKVEFDAKAQNEKDKNATRPSEQAMEDTEKFKGSSPEPDQTQREDAEKNLKNRAREISKATGKPEKEVEQQLKDETSKKKWEAEFEAKSEGPFYRPVRLGEQKRVLINTDHPFYSRIYSDAPPIARSALEVLLFVLGERELEVTKDAETFYKAERQRWSERLRYALESLVSNQSLTDTANAVAEELQMGVETESSSSGDEASTS